MKTKNMTIETKKAPQLLSDAELTNVAGGSGVSDFIHCIIETAEKVAEKSWGWFGLW